MTRKTGARRNRALTAFLILLAACALVIAILNWVVMPLATRHGQDVVVPGVVGMERFEAEAVLARAGLALGEVRLVPSARVAPEHVTAQHPAPGRKVKRGRVMMLEVSKGASRLKVPHAQGLSVTRAIALLTEARLVVDGVESLRTPGVPVGQVVGTRPTAGTEVSEGDHVMVQVSSRVGSFPMPNLIGMSIETAQGIIASQGLLLGELRRTPSDEPSGSVLVQYPEDGRTVRAGDSVHLIVASRHQGR